MDYSCDFASFSLFAALAVPQKLSNAAPILFANNAWSAQLCGNSTMGVSSLISCLDYLLKLIAAKSADDMCEQCSRVLCCFRGLSKIELATVFKARDVALLK